MSLKNKTALCFSPYPYSGASVRHRIIKYKNTFSEFGVDLSFCSFMTNRFFNIRRKFDFFFKIEKYLQFIFCSFRLIINVFRSPFYDFIIIHREVFPLGKPYFELLISKLNKNLIYDIDDAIWFKPSNDVNQRNICWYENRVAEITQASSAVVAGNKFLSEYLSSFCENTFIIPTPYDSHTRENNFIPTEKKKVLWVGNVGNALYLEQIISALEKVNNDYPFTLVLCGGDDIKNITSDELEIEHHLWTEKIELKLLDECDIGIMPLLDADYEKGKCSFKIIQYFSSSLAVLASPVGMNKDVIENGVNGYLVLTVSDWIKNLSRLLTDDELRMKISKNGNDTYLKTYSRNVTSKQWYDVFEKVIEV